MTQTLLQTLRMMQPYVHYIRARNAWVASVGTGFETCWWPEAEGATPEEAVRNLQTKLAQMQ